MKMVLTAAAMIALQSIAPAHSAGRTLAPTYAAPPPVSPVYASPALVRAALATLGMGNFTGHKGPWCAWGVSAWLRSIGKPPLSGGMVSAALAYGPRLSAPRVGALAVTKGLTHVAVIAEVNGDDVVTINGNWGHRVRIAHGSARRYIFIGVS